ncbi:MAG: hypothetical protein QOD07_3145 [Frankiaceae bacterium]|jgi:hypothetical protein|nr:hypothetical protein [Frankiaceae bacterium]
MDADQAATVFVEICTRLDELLAAQRRTNELLGGLESALRDHLQARTDDSPEEFRPSRPPRGLGHLIPYGGDDNLRTVTATPTVTPAASSPGPDQLAATGP